ncbi:MAG TPA: hypothetical protein DHV60_08130, partial [Verrucomicrobiales bacterium]|nr:hypothetical protein [Verrucomicrobiales bacterium]
DANATATGLIGGLHDDDDGDQLSNGLEFFFGTDAKQWTANPVVSSQAVDGSIQFQIPINGDAVSDGISPTVQDSVNLIDWYEAGTVNSVLSIDSDTSGVGVSGVQVWKTAPEVERAFLRFNLPN